MPFLALLMPLLEVILDLVAGIVVDEIKQPDTVTIHTPDATDAQIIRHARARIAADH